MIDRLRRKFIQITMFSVTLVILIMGISINVINYISVNSNLEEMLTAIQENQGEVPDYTKEKPPDGTRAGVFSPESAYSTRYFVLQYDSDGTLLETDMRHIAAVTEDDTGDFLAIALAHGEGFGSVGQYKYSVQQLDDGSYIAIFMDCSKDLYSMRLFALATVLVVAVCVLLVYVLVLFLSKWATDPVVRSVERQKQFITDASHELKTPLTVITTSLKVLEMEVGQQKWIDKAQSQADHMRDLVNDLVTLSRLDEERPALQMSRFDISEAVQDTAESFQDFAAAQDHALVLDIPSGITYCGDEYSIRQLVSILMDNAVKYASPGSSISLRLERSRKGVTLRTANACAPISQEDLQRLFDRFYRVEKSRSKQTGGFGVGLSIARSIAEAHKGSIRAQAPSEGQIEFIVILK